jgi:poly(A) polymerase
MSEFDPIAAEALAVEVVRKLRDAGFEALWAGGCVRDALLERQPKDYDVATSAEPQQVRDLFGHRRTLAIGVAFGVVSVLGPRSAGQVQVATFRRDAAYSDGRHPDRVTYSTAQHDAQRRDFTMNGLFYDPLQKRVIDYVGGQEDLRRGIVRAIGNPFNRIAEDKLRMLRAVRFAATFGFEIESETFAAIQRSASGITIVSAERIAEEMRRMLTHIHRARAVELLHATELLRYLLPEMEALASYERGAWESVLLVLAELGEVDFPLALAGLLIEARESGIAEVAADRWRLSNEERQAAKWLLDNLPVALKAADLEWPRVQRVLRCELAGDLLKLADATVRVKDGDRRSIEFCRAKLALPREMLDPPPLVTGDDLKHLGIPPGRFYAFALAKCRDAQLSGEIATTGAARELAAKLWSLERTGGTSE